MMLDTFCKELALWVRWKEREEEDASSKVDEIRVVRSVLLENLKDQFRDRSTWRKCIYVMTKG